MVFSKYANGRYMTPQGKSEALQEWFKAKADRIANPPQGFTGGLGYPDPEIYAHVERLNRMSRLCTLQSCAGHRCVRGNCCVHCAASGAGAVGEWPEDTHVWNGQLWLWADEALSRWFLHHAPELALLQPEIEKVSVLWHVETREIIDIQFRGAGHGTLADSMGIVCSFFERGTMECNLR